MKLFYFLLAFTLSFTTIQAQDCYDGRYKNHVFNNYDVDVNNFYAKKRKSNGVWQNLMYDVYTPKNDTETNRPVVFLAHGGGFIDVLDQRSPDIVRMARDLVARGYVVFSVEYREEPNPFSLFSEENMVKALGRALIDIREATCYLMDTTLNHGNPYGVDPERVIIGGVSAGAVSFLQAVFLDELAWIPEQYQEWLLEMEPNTQALLDNKYCGANVLGVINISGAILDTSWIKAEKVEEYPPILHVHGTADDIVPYNIAKPFGIPTLPRLMGSYPIDKKLKEIGVRSELDTWHGYGHVPFFGIDLLAIFGNNPLDFIFNPVVLDPTLEHIGDFCYSLIGCNELITGIDESKTAQLNFYPNPSKGNLTIELPEFSNNSSGNIRIINTNGVSVYELDINSGTSKVELTESFPNGMYTVVIDYIGPFVNKYFTGQLIVSN